MLNVNSLYQSRLLDRVKEVVEIFCVVETSKEYISIEILT